MMENYHKEKYTEIIECLLRDLVAKITALDASAFWLDGVSLEKLIISELKKNFLADREKYECFTCVKEEERKIWADHFRNELFSQYILSEEPVPVFITPSLKSYYSCPYWEALEDYWGQVLVFCNSPEELDYFLPFLQQTEEEAVLLVRCEVPEELEFSDRVTLVEFDFLKELYVFNFYLYHKFPQFYKLGNTFAPLLDILQPVKVMLVDDVSIDSSLLSLLCERRSIPVLHYQRSVSFTVKFGKANNLPSICMQTQEKEGDGKIHLFWFECPFSGVGSYSREMLNYLEKQPEIIVIQVYLECSEVREQKISKISNGWIIKIPSASVYNNGQESDNCKILKILTPWLKTANKIIFHLNECGYSLLAQEARRLYGVKIVYTLHFLADYFSYSSFGTNKLKIVGGKAAKEMIRIADRVICVTDFARKVVINHYNKSEKNVELIYNGFSDFHTVKRLPKDKSELRKKYGFQQNDIILMYVGRIAASKGIKELLKDFCFLVSKYEHIRLVIIGGGDFNYAMVPDKAAWGHIHWLSEIDREAVLEMYRLADLGLIPSLYEQCSYVSLEMMSVGLPVVASDALGLCEVLKAGENAEVFFLHREEGGLKIPEGVIAVAIDKLLQQPDIAQKIGKNGYRIWEEYFQRDKMGAHTLQLYKSLAGLDNMKNIMNEKVDKN